MNRVARMLMRAPIGFYRIGVSLIGDLEAAAERLPLFRLAPGTPR